MKTKEIDEAKIKAQSIIWCDNSLEEKETMMNNLLSTLRQSVLEEVREKMPKKKEYQKPLAVHLIDRVYDCDVSSFNNCHDQVTSLINNLIEKK